MTIRKQYVETCKTWQDDGNKRKKQNTHTHTHTNTGVIRLDQPLMVWGNWSGSLIPTLGQLSGAEEKHWRLKVKQLICDRLNGIRIRQSLLQPYVSWIWRQVPSGWELECRDCRTIPEWELLLTAERWTEGTWGRRLWWEMLTEERQEVMEARWNC